MTALAWFVIAIVCGAIEIITSGFWLLFFAISGAVVALGVYTGLLNNMESQLLVFALLSLVFVLFARPLVVNLIKSDDKPSNTQALIGQYGVSLTDIKPLGFGQVKVRGEIWTAITDEVIASDQTVEIIAIDGVKLVVIAAEQEDQSID